MNCYKSIIFLFCLCTACLSSFSQHVKLSLTVSGTGDMQRVPNATIILNQQKYKADSLGNTIIEVIPGQYTINVSSVNFYPFTNDFTIARDTSIDILLRMRESLLGNVTVVSSRNVVSNQMSVQSISGVQLRKLPVIFGEVDPLKTITLLP